MDIKDNLQVEEEKDYRQARGILADLADEPSEITIRRLRDEQDALYDDIYIRIRADALKRKKTLEKWFEWAKSQYETDSEEFGIIVQLQIDAMFKRVIAYLEAL